MKHKHIGLLGMGVAAVAVAAIAVQLLWASWNPVRPAAMRGILDSFSSERLQVDSSAMARMDLVGPTLASLVKPERVATRESLAAVRGVDYGMFGKRPPVAPTVARAEPSPPPAAPPPPFEYRVGMTYVSGDYRYAVVNMRLYQQGARLPNGDKLAEISANAVRIESRDGPRWVSIHRTDQSERPPGG